MGIFATTTAKVSAIAWKLDMAFSNHLPVSAQYFGVHWTFSS